MSPERILNILAKNRTSMANERTLLAYIRTAIMLVVSGVTLIKFFGKDFHFLVLGVALLPLALAFTVFGFIRYRSMVREIKNITRMEQNVQKADLHG